MADPIGSFWSWWKTARTRIAKAIEGRDLGALEGEITKHVEAIDPGLRWELGGGEGKTIGFSLVWDGDLRRRRVTEQWLARAPKSDPTWDYHPARVGGKDWEHLVMELGPHNIDFSKFTCTFQIDKTKERIDAKIFHPALAKAPEHVRGTATFVMLDSAFGEDGVERWMGVIDLAKSKPKDAKPLTDLVKAVAKLARTATGDQCALYQGTRDGSPIFIMKNEALKPIDHLDCDAELAIAIAIDSPTADGLPTKKESIALDALEDALIEALDGDAAYHGRETHAGTRTIYFFAPKKGAAATRVEKWKKKLKRTVKVSWTPDPTWEGLTRWS